MKKLFALLLAVCLLVPTSALGSEPEPNYWICSQVGRVQKDYIYAVSPIFMSTPNQYEDKEFAFEDAVQEQTEGAFHPDFEARCWEFGTEENAQRFLKKKLMKAEKRNFQILWIKFSY